MMMITMHCLMWKIGLVKYFILGINYMCNGKFIGNDSDNDLDEIVENLIGNLDIEKVK